MAPSRLMAGLRVPPGPGLPHGLLVPDSELTERFSKSSGPGGQSVNTTDSRVELVYDVEASAALEETQRARIIGRCGPRIVVVAEEHRSQYRNRQSARDRLAQLLREACSPPPPPRIPTKPSKGSQRRRLDSKTRRGRIKRLRGRVQD